MLPGGGRARWVRWGRGSLVDVHGVFVNSLIPSSGGEAEQPSVRADPLAPRLFLTAAFQSKVDSSVEHLWSVNDANIHAAVRLGGKITRDAKQKSTRLHLTIRSYFRSCALYLEGEDLKCSFSFHLHTPTTLVNTSEERDTTKY